MRIVFGSMDVIVPHGVEVDLEAACIMSSKVLRVNGPAPIGYPPRIVITGTIVGGSLTVRDSPADHEWRA